MPLRARRAGAVSLSSFCRETSEHNALPEEPPYLPHAPDHALCRWKQGSNKDPTRIQQGSNKQREPPPQPLYLSHSPFRTNLAVLVKINLQAAVATRQSAADEEESSDLGSDLGATRTREREPSLRVTSSEPPCRAACTSRASARERSPAIRREAHSGGRVQQIDEVQ